MRIVSRNTCQGFDARKRAALEALRPDAAVLCEATRANPWEGSLLGPVCWQADGVHANRQAAVAGFGEGFTPHDALVRAGDHCAALEGPGFGLLAVWSVVRPKGTYADEVLRIVEANAGWIGRGDVVVAGDLNVDANGVADSPRRGAAQFAEIVARMRALGLVSAYHAVTGEPFGAETWPTLYFLRKRDRPFHIDYCFVPQAWVPRIVHMTVGAPDPWLSLSDHMPLVLDLDLPAPGTGEDVVLPSA